MMSLPLVSCSEPTLSPAELEDLLAYLHRDQKIDLTGYKRASLLRRVLVRMQQVRLEHYQHYLDLLKQQPEEVTHLLNTVFINVTQFFRDRPVWDYLANEAIPQIIANKADDEPIRIWSAGSASGEEAYSLAMLLIEALGVDAFQQRVRIYGTDVDEDALQQARRGWYGNSAVEAIPEPFLSRYFQRIGEGHCWRNDLRRPVSFHSHNLFQNAPLPRMDLLLCRNTLMYFMSEIQIRALVRFHFSLQENGLLLLGQTEYPITYIQSPKSTLFTPTNRKIKIFAKVPNAQRDPKLLTLAFRRRIPTILDQAS